MLIRYTLRVKCFTIWPKTLNLYLFILLFFKVVVVYLSTENSCVLLVKLFIFYSND